jgi:B12-binding domain/radical SAM domain protein
MYDILLLHPPAIYDFRKKVVFPGPIAQTVQNSTPQFMIFPVGMLSIAEYLKRSGYNVKLVNLGELMVRNTHFDVENFIRTSEANIYGIDLHWVTHLQGSIEVAKICKKYHPNSMTVLGGLTATRFHVEILKEFPFIDVIIRGEAEKPFLKLADSREKSQPLDTISNLTYRKNGKIYVNPIMKPCETLNEFEFTCLNLVWPQDVLSIRAGLKWWNVPVCRGCVYNCVTCGGSAYSYRVLHARNNPAFRKPEKIAEDLEKLGEQGIKVIFLFQDIRMGGRKYWRKLLLTLRREKIDLTQLNMELFEPVNEEFIKGITSLGVPLALSISPESGVESVRRLHGRSYSNEELLQTVNLCRKHNARLGVFFMIGLAGETYDSLKATWKLCEKLFAMDRKNRERVNEKCFPAPLHFKPEFGPMILLDPGSLAYDFPERYGYNLIYKNLADLYKAMSLPSWHLWMNYETKYMSRADLVNAILKSLDQMLYLEEKYGLYEHPIDIARLNFARFKIKINRLIIREVDRILKLDIPIKEMDTLLRNLYEVTLAYLEQELPLACAQISSRYKKDIENIILRSSGLMTLNKKGDKLKH